MALGGGIFTAQNKVLPGAYMNFVSLKTASAALSNRGIATIPLEMDWGLENSVFTVEIEDFLKNSQKLFGYDYTVEALKPMREIFKHAKTVHFFRLNTNGVKAGNNFAVAKYSGKRGNDLRIAVALNEDGTEETPLYDVSTYLETRLVDIQKGVATITDLKSNAYVDWKQEGTLSVTASTPLTGGTNGTIENSAYQSYLDQIESYSFNTMGCPSDDETIVGLFVAFCKRMREEIGKKFQCVVAQHLADYEGIISVKNGIAPTKESTPLVPWVTGLMAGATVNKSVTNMEYDGEYEIDVNYTQSQLENSIKEGSFLFHLVDGRVRVLSDVNTFISVTAEKSADFSNNQTIRILDQIANDIAVLFANNYIGKVSNDASGRISLWNDIVKHHQQLVTMRAIEDFKPENISVTQGDSKKSVVITDFITPVSAMEQLYMTVYVE